MVNTAIAASTVTRALGRIPHVISPAWRPRWGVPLPALAVLLNACTPSSDDIYSGPLPERVDFNFDVKPILSDRCFACHGPDPEAREAELRLDTDEGIEAVRGSGLLTRNELVRRITASDSAHVMPPPESGLTLSDYEKAVLARWIEQGAEYQPHWSFIPPTQPALPEVEDPAWVRNPIDRFVLARLEREGLSPSPEADEARLIRRVTYDLTGLPPSLEELDQFLQDTASNAYENLVDRLLGSPAFGERMASEWLDLARYADSHGYQDDGIRHMWAWRDWVIRSFNENLPYDEFVTYQLAGDLLPNPTRDQVLATGFNRNHAQNAEGGIVDEEYRVAYVADRVTTVGRGLMGLSMDCAQCHDHKYDPITQQEYYQLFAFFNNIDEIGLTAIDGNNGPVLLLPDEATDQALRDVRDEIQARERSVNGYWAALRRDAETLERAESARVDLSAGLIGHFTFDGVEAEANGGQGVAPNLADERYPATLDSGARIVPGKQADAFEVRDGAVARVQEAYAFDRSDPFSFSLWVRPTETHDRAPILTRSLDDNGGANRGYELNLHRDSVFVGLMHIRSDDAIRLQTEKILPLDQWTHLAVTYDGAAGAAGLDIYIDGEPAPAQVLSDNLRRTIVPATKDDGTRAHLQIGGKRVGSDVATFEGGAIDDVRIYDRPLSALQVAELAGRDDVAPTPDARLEHVLETQDEELARRLAALRESLARETRLLTDVDDVMVMRERIAPRPTHVLERGMYDAPLDPVQPGTPAAILPFDEDLPRNRLGLAQWLFDPQHPLTARAAVNRYWQMLFGNGLVGTSDDFGNQGELPTHPALLDWLAITYRDSGWDTKALLKRIVMSNTYRQASHHTPELRERDPDNQWLARGPSFRLPAEAVRDAALAASGLLVRRLGGPSVRPYQPDGLWEEKSAGRGELATYVQDHGEDLYRRSLYIFRKRSSPPPMLETFDSPDRAVCTVRREVTNTPLQSLNLLNDPAFVEAARVLGQRMMREGGPEVDERLRFGFRTVTSRAPTEDELRLLRSLYGKQRGRFRADETGARGLLTVGETPADPGLDRVELAAYAVVANTLLNLDEAISKR